MRIFKRKPQPEQPARTAALRELLKTAYSDRYFSDSELRDLAVRVQEFLFLFNDPELALQSPATPAQLLFALAATKNEHGAFVKSLINGIAAMAAGKGN